MSHLAVPAVSTCLSHLAVPAVSTCLSDPSSCTGCVYLSVPSSCTGCVYLSVPSSCTGCVYLLCSSTMAEIQTKRQERKRRSTANPAYSGLVQPEVPFFPSNYLNDPLFLSVRELEHDDHCSVCKGDGELQLCHNCPRAYHPDCLHPPLKTPPRGVWVCTKSVLMLGVFVCLVREGEKRSLLRRNVELKKECAHLEEQDQQLSTSLTRLIGQQRDTQSSLERLKALIRLIQRDQMIQVTMTATATTTGVSLLSLPWIKPSGEVSMPRGHLSQRH
uniref:PHD finger protein 21B-like n=1 Tax=Oncorhynchus kisutch TaxID=8019 RepID=A0A8C7KDL3_ONCKI